MIFRENFLFHSYEIYFYWSWTHGSITSQGITSFFQKIFQSLNKDVSGLIVEVKRKSKRISPVLVSPRIYVEEADLIRLFQTGRQTSARSRLYLPTSDVQCRIINDEFQLYFNQSFRSTTDSGLKHMKFCPFCETKKKKVSFESGLHLACGRLKSIQLVNGCSIMILLELGCSFT